MPFGEHSVSRVISWLWATPHVDGIKTMLHPHLMEVAMHSVLMGHAELPNLYGAIPIVASAESTTHHQPMWLCCKPPSTPLQFCHLSKPLLCPLVIHSKLLTPLKCSTTHSPTFTHDYVQYSSPYTTITHDTQWGLPIPGRPCY